MSLSSLWHLPRTANKRGRLPGKYPLYFPMKVR